MNKLIKYDLSSRMTVIATQDQNSRYYLSYLEVFFH